MSNPHSTSCSADQSTENSAAAPSTTHVCDGSQYIIYKCKIVNEIVNYIFISMADTDAHKESLI